MAPHGATHDASAATARGTVIGWPATGLRAQPPEADYEMLTSKPLIHIGVGLSAAWLIAAPARAETGDAGIAREDEASGRFEFQPPQHELRVAVGTGLLVGLSSAESGFSDTLADQRVGALDTSLAVRYQAPSVWSASVRASWSMSGNAVSAQLDRDLWQLAAEGRWQPEGELGPYATLGAGAGLVVDSYRGASSWQWAPLISGALGADIASLGPVALGLELRGIITVFGEAGERFEVDGEQITNAYGAVPWLGLNLIATLGL